MDSQEEVYNYSDVDIYSLYESSEMILESKITEATKRVCDRIIEFLKKIVKAIKDTFDKVKNFFKKSSTNLSIFDFYFNKYIIYGIIWYSII